MTTSVHLSDEEALADAPRELSIRALPGRAIVWLLPYRRASGVIEIPDKCQPDSAEGVIINDATGYELNFGTRVGVSRLKGDGKYFEIEEEKLLNIGKDGLLIIDTQASPEYAE